MLAIAVLEQFHENFLLLILKWIKIHIGIERYNIFISLCLLGSRQFLLPFSFFFKKNILN